jgi:hypothetical protein
MFLSRRAWWIPVQPVRRAEEQAACSSRAAGSGVAMRPMR